MFSISLKICSSVYELDVSNKYKKYDCNLENEVAILSDICSLLQESNAVEFKVSGFGQERWPVDVGVDLAVILEQLPNIIHTLESDNFTFILDFYEQGIERQLHFSQLNSTTKIHCISGTDWKPEPNIILIETKVISKQFIKLYDDFLDIIENVFPKDSSNTLLVKWRK